MISDAAESEPVPSASAITDLTADQQQRLTQLLDQYLRGLEQGQPVEVRELLEGNGDLANVLRVYLAKLDGLHDIAAGFQSHGELEPLVSGETGSRVRSLQLGDYTILREIGRGGMGIVYEARQRSLDRRVALKLLPLASMLDSRQIARFKNESHAAAQLHHPNIVPVYCVGVERGIHFYAMQFIEGKSVDAWIEDSADKDLAGQWRETVRIAIDIALALHCAHESGIVHRDIKPSNLMLDDRDKAWVTDFGLARCQNDLSLTLSGHLVGTMRYMSPEQAAGRAELVDHRTDVYSLGATLYEMITGRAAIGGDDSPSVLREIANGTPPRLHRIMPRIPADLDVVLQKAMSKQKDDRYTTAEEFAEDLQAVLDDRPTIAKPPSPAVIAGRWASRHRRLVAVASMSLIVGVIGLMASLVIIAEKNRDITRYFRQAKETIDQLGSVEAQLASVPGVEHIRQSLLEDTLSYYEQFVEQAHGDPELRSDVALTHSRMGAIIKELHSAEQSIPHYQRSAEIYRDLAAKSLASPSIARARAQNLNQLGLALFDSGQLSHARSTYEHALRLQQNLLERSNLPEHRTDLALTKSNLGLLLGEIGQVDLAREQLTEAVELLSDVRKANVDDILATRGLAAAKANLSSLAVDNNPRLAISLLEQAIDDQLRISKDPTGRLKASSEIATNYNNLGAAYLAANDSGKAATAFANAVRIQRHLHAIAPRIDAYRFELAMSLNNLASALHAQNDGAGAQQAAREAVSLQEACLQRESPTAASLSRLGVMYNNLGTSLEAMGETISAIAAMESAVKHQKSAIAMEPQSQSFGQHLLQHDSNLLRLQIQDQRWQDAARTSNEYRRAAEYQPARMLAVAQDMATQSKRVPTSDERDSMVSDIAATLTLARRAGVEFDSAVLLSEPLRSFAHIPSLRKAVQP